jgi:hypothetical protein
MEHVLKKSVRGGLGSPTLKLPSDTDKNRGGGQFGRRSMSLSALNSAELKEHQWDTSPGEVELTDISGGGSDMARDASGVLRTQSEHDFRMTGDISLCEDTGTTHACTLQYTCTHTCTSPDPT